MALVFVELAPEFVEPDARGDLALAREDVPPETPPPPAPVPPPPPPATLPIPPPPPAELELPPLPSWGMFVAVLVAVELPPMPAVVFAVDVPLAPTSPL